MPAKHKNESARRRTRSKTQIDPGPGGRVAPSNPIERQSFLFCLRGYVQKSHGTDLYTCVLHNMHTCCMHTTKCQCQCLCCTFCVLCSCNSAMSTLSASARRLQKRTFDDASMQARSAPPPPPAVASPRSRGISEHPHEAPIVAAWRAREAQK